jgi:opacity protein-like surface antigen
MFIVIRRLSMTVRTCFNRPRRLARSLLALIAGAVTLTGVARAQAPVAPTMLDPGSWYAEGVAQAAFGNVTSQSYGGEFGVSLGYGLQVFVEGGRTRDVATSELAAAAQVIAGFLGQTQTAVGYRAQQPVNFGVAGLKYLIPVNVSVLPYIMAGGGIAKVMQDVSFTVNGSDVTGVLPQYGVVLGSDLSGAKNYAMFTLGAGIMWPVWQHLIVDFQYRYGRIDADPGINVNRAGIGLGVRF